MRNLIALLALCALSAFGQTDRYFVSGVATLAASDYTITIAQPDENGRRFELETVVVQASGGEITVSLERDCSTVTVTTPVSIVVVNPESTPPGGARFKAYANSAAASCTSFSNFSAEKGWKIPNKSMITLPGSGLYKEGSGLSKNLTIRLSGTAGYLALWQIAIKETR
jgi:hypothetical protein